MISMADIVTGDELVVYMRLGLPLQTGRRPDGSGYRVVADKPRRASADAITRFRGSVITNDVAEQILKTTTVEIDSQGTPQAHSPPLVAEISYSALRQVFLLSSYSFEARDELSRRTGTNVRPTTAALGTAFRPYRTISQVRIPR